MLRIVPWGGSCTRIERLRTECVTHIIPLTLALIMVVISGMLRSGNGLGAPRASPACNNANNQLLSLFEASGHAVINESQRATHVVDQNINVSKLLDG